MFGKSKIANRKIDKSTEQIIDLETQKKRLEMERDEIQLDLENQKKRWGMKLEEEAHKHKLLLMEEKSVFDREQQIWVKDKEELIARNTRDREEFEKRLKQEFEINKQEAVTLINLDSQQKVKQAELDRDREINKIKTSHAEELSKVKSDTAETYYKKLTEAFQDMQINGDKNTKFVQEMALKIFDKVPAGKTDVGVTVDTGANAGSLQLAKGKK